MKWTISFSRQAKDFLGKQKVKEEVLGLIKNAILKFQGEIVSLDIKKMKGEWQNSYRIRKGKYRIIALFDFEKHFIHIEIVDWRGNIY